MNYDLVIIGSGSVGSAAGYYAAQAGLKVLMLDAYTPPHRHGSHHGDTRIIRHAYGEGEKYVPLLMRAQALWEQLESMSAVQLLHRCGVLNAGPEDSVFLRNVRTSAERFGLNVQRFDAAQLRQRWPEFNVPDNYLGLFEPDAGYLKAELAISLLNEKAAESGAELRFNCPVTALSPDGDGVLVTTAQGNVRARRAAVTAGTWVTALLPQLPVTPVRKVFSWHQADGRYSENNHFPAFTVETPEGEHFYGFPSHNIEGLKLGKHDGGQPISSPEQRRPFGHVAQDGSEVFSFLRRFLPGIGVCLHGEACTYDLSPDEDFIIDDLPNAPQISIVSGLSGHGFKFATVLGEILALKAQGKTPAFDISPFALGRFSV
ncbi:N-methyl-L-tryptophan oxidase [Enterobacillus tribolii]|uniref:N-methyl-L-tryptophan oxidase n=1 Tax=Enterobacillus tribolii TaxID=1487935 RepID=A0A370R362_9GAMM|nr:N-methyl-L-tryptophan oxidase [Enterobacillus tribolii]MBW7983929.1 N-methyl-L-tryptophan oxidase [Enterobacillus tribolii]RDK96866.1 N-methyl-L-tryptophan oxidase [Enterobacillus tribolii]